MDAIGFKKWLEDNHICTTSKQTSDCVSRAKNVENKFKNVFGAAYDLDAEYDRDGLEDLRRALSVYGQTHYMKDYIPNGASTGFNIGKPSMGALSNAILKYQRYKKSLQEECI